MKNIFYFIIISLLLVTGLTFISAAETSIGTKKQGDCIDLIQSCADCTYINFTSFTYPNGTRVIWEVPGVQNGVSFTYYNCSLTSELGTWIIDGHGDLGGTDTVFTYTYDVTSSGNVTPTGMPTFQVGVIIIIFGIACFLLFLSTQMQEVGFKIFFLLVSLVFLSATMITAYMVGAEGNIASSVNTTTLSLFVVLGTILFVIFAYILIRQTIAALELYKINRGREWSVGIGNRLTGYDQRRPY